MPGPRRPESRDDVGRAVTRTADPHADGSDGAGPVGAVHEAFLYSTPYELAQRLVPRLAPALDDGGPVVAVLDEPTRAEVRRALGDDADRVEYADPSTVHRLPPFTVAVRWARLSRLVTTPQGRATVVGQHVADLPGCGENHWARLDIGLNVALAGLPITVLCPYRTDVQELARVHATHPHVTTAQGSMASDGYREPAEALVEFPPPPAPDLGPPAAELAFTAFELGALRHLVAEVAARGGTDPNRVRRPRARGQRDRLEQHRARVRAGACCGCGRRTTA